MANPPFNWKVPAGRALEAALNQLPQFVQGQTQSTIGAVALAGRASLNLRGLGETRNLVLLDGRRLPLRIPGRCARSAGQEPDDAAENQEKEEKSHQAGIPRRSGRRAGEGRKFAWKDGVRALSTLVRYRWGKLA